MIGKTLGHYTIRGLLGRGAMGEVYLADDERLGRSVALKIPPPDVATDSERLARSEREARAVAALNHPNIVTLYSIENADGVTFLTMELVEGEDLGRLLPAGGFELERLFELAIPIADALATAHQAGITHRDLKPENVMVTEKGQVKILDFGLAKLLPTDSPEAGPEGETQLLTEAGMVMGTIPYMSPEQVAGRPVDHRSDIFSLGVMLYEMATGDRPFDGETSAHLISAIMRDEPPPVTDLKPLPNHLGRVIRRCLEKDPDRRYHSALEIRNELENLRLETLQAAGSTGLPASGSEAGAAAATSPPVEKAVEGGVAEARKRHGRWLGVAVAAALAVGAIWWWLGGREAPESAPAAGGPPSVAVLPFTNLGGSDEDEFFCDGLTEELIHALAQVEGLRVPARTSVFAFKGKEADIREVGQQLGVDYLLEGSVRRSGEALRITAQLVKASDGFHVWSQTFDRRMEDVFAVQDGIARNIVQSLEVTLRPDEERSLLARRSASPQAYDFYLRGQGYYRRGTLESMRKAVEAFSRATEIDPDYAPAWAGLGIAFGAIYLNFETEAENLERAFETSRRALELAPDLGEAHRALASALAARRDYDESEREYERAISLDPSRADTYRAYGISSFARGKLEQAAGLFEQANALDPHDYRTLSLLPQIYRRLGRTADLEATFRRMLELVDRSLSVDPDDVQAMLRKANALIALGRREDGLEWTEKVLATTEDDALIFYNAGCLFSLAGETERAIDALERSFAAGLADPEWMRHDSDLDPVRDHPRFEALMREMEAAVS